MSYAKSSARKDIEVVVRYLKHHSKYASYKKNGLNFDIQQFVYKASIFQSYAAFEEYIKSVFEDWIYLLNTKNKLLSNVPHELKIWIIGKTQQDVFKRYIVNRDENELIASLCKLSTLPMLFNENTDAKKVIHKGVNTSDRKYPSIKNIKLICKRFGVKDVIMEMNKKGKKDYKNILESLSDKRIEMAHQHPSPDLTLNDIINYLNSLLDIIDKIDKILFDHVSKVSGIDCWQTSALAPNV